MDENPYNVIKEVHDQLHGIEDLSDPVSRDKLISNIAKLRTLLYIYGGGVQTVEPEGLIDRLNPFKGR